MRPPVTTPAQLRRVQELLSEAIEILETFQAEVKAAGQEDEELNDLLDALATPFFLEGRVDDAADELASDYESGREADLNQTIYHEGDFAEAETEAAQA